MPLSAMISPSQRMLSRFYNLKILIFFININIFIVYISINFRSFEINNYINF